LRGSHGSLGGSEVVKCGDGRFEGERWNGCTQAGHLT